jgi:hypothetical protein
MTVDVYAPDGKLKGTSIWCVSDGALGPRLDPKGNIYLADCVKPPGKRWPDELNGRLPKGSAEHWYEWTYGSLVKFGPEGGAVMFPPNKNMPSYVYPFEGEPKLAPGLKEEKVAGTFRDGLRLPTRLIGAKWWHYGFSTLQDMIATSGEYGMGGDHCHCTGTDFDVDDFGRSFYPDQMRFRVGVLDTNGNLMLHIGTYGNQDSCGPDSYVLDPKGKFLRPRKADDPKDLKSPFAEPEIAFGWIVGMAVTDKHLYVADSTNRRILRVKLDYAATETVPAP